MQKLCHLCNQSPPYGKSNSARYCLPCKDEKERQRQAINQIKHNDKKALTPSSGKLECLVCHRYYKRPIAHARQRHELTEREYKAMHGLDHKKGIITNEARETLRAHVQSNYDIVVTRNLHNPQAINQTRFKPNDPRAGRYKRSAQTMERLKQQSFTKKHL